jgi:hypothetical protein
LQYIKEQFPFLAKMSDQFLRSNPLGELLKMGTTQMKMQQMDKSKGSSDRLSSNKQQLENTFTRVAQGEDNRSTNLHEARFLAGAGVSLSKQWLSARRHIGMKGQVPIGCYDMAAIGLGGMVSSKGWIEAHDPGSSRMRIQMFTIGSCSNRSEAADGEREISDVLELRLAMRTMKAAVRMALPWNWSIDALENFFIQTSYCWEDTNKLEKRAAVITQFIDYVLQQNAERWRDEIPFLTTPELKQVWETFFATRAKGLKEKQPRQQGRQSAPTTAKVGSKPYQGFPKEFLDLCICIKWNKGMCTAKAGDCKSFMGKPLKHICMHMADRSKPAEVCGKDHKMMDHK